MSTDLRHDIRLTRIHVDDILNSRTWRALELYRKARIRAGLSGVNPAAIRAALFAGAGSTGRCRDAVREQPAGINVAGYLDAESGMGEAARASIRSIEAAGCPVALNNVPSLLRTRDASYRAAFVDANPHPFNLVHLNGDNMPAFAAARGRRYFRDRYTIGYWFWELSTLETRLGSLCRLRRRGVDGHPVRARRRKAACTVPTRKDAPSDRIAADPASRPRALQPARRAAGVPVHLRRVEPDRAQESARRDPRIPPGRGCRTTTRCWSSSSRIRSTIAPGFAASTRRRQGSTSSFSIGYLDRPELCALVNTADCYLSPHRAEGFGLTLLEAMRLGKPVIGTAYSGNMDFMTAGNSYLLDYSLVTLTRDYGPYFRGAVWAEPDVDHAARLIRQVAEHPAEAADRGARAKADVERDWSADVTGRAVRDRLEAIRAGRRLEIAS